MRVSGSRLIEPNAFSRRSSPPSRRAPAWDCRSVGQSSSRMPADCEPVPTPDGTQPFSSHWRPRILLLSWLATSWARSPFGMKPFLFDSFGGSISKCLRRYSYRKRDSVGIRSEIWLSRSNSCRSPTLSVGPATTRTTKAAAKLQMQRSCETLAMACDMHEERAGGVHHEETLRSRSIRAVALQQS